MTDTTFHPTTAMQDMAPSTEIVTGWNGLRATGLLAALERAFVAWQNARLRTLTPERLWAAAMTDSRSFAEIRRARRRQA
ncbi:MAG TPA: hypothetical protein VL522_05895 [Bordetella sp.]|jgi:hypothetical protein|nr:hypothetical protein [Bordetella sp.]